MTFHVKMCKKGFYHFNKYQRILKANSFCSLVKRQLVGFESRRIWKSEPSNGQYFGRFVNGYKPFSEDSVDLRDQQNRCISTENRKLPIIYLFTKEECTLCDEAKLSLKPYSHRFILEEVDITLPENEPWYELYKYDIPVFHMFEEFLFKHRVNFKVLEKALEAFETKL